MSRGKADIRGRKPASRSGVTRRSLLKQAGVGALTSAWVASLLEGAEPVFPNRELYQPPAQAPTDLVIVCHAAQIAEPRML